MKRLLVLAILTAVPVNDANADPVAVAVYNVTDATMFMRPNIVGDNIEFAFSGPGVTIMGDGGMACFTWCTSTPIAPGVPVTATRISIENFTNVVLGGVSYEPHTEIGITDPPLFNDSGGVNPIVMGFAGSGSTFTEFRLMMPTNGAWTFNFAPATDATGNPALVFVNGTFSAATVTPTPEPGTLGLLVVGSAIVWMTERQRRKGIGLRLF